MEPETLRSVARAVSIESEKVKGSRFIADATPIANTADMDQFLTSIKARESAASHHCWAYRLNPEEQRSSDDGEPSGTAGPPILTRIVGAKLLNVGVVVTRYYGGTKLGTGGLIRAYGAAAAAAIASADIVKTIVTETVSFRYPYTLSVAVDRTMADHNGEVVEASYGEDVLVTAAIPRSAFQKFRLALAEATSGIVTIPERE